MLNEIKITPAVYDFTNVYLDLDIGLSNVVKSDDMYPIINKDFKQSLNLKGGSFYF